jgi:endonuclease YncB( thermonuclease family)
MVRALQLASALGLVGVASFALRAKDFDKMLPKQVLIKTIIDGDTFETDKGIVVRLTGVDAPDRGQKGDLLATEYLKQWEGKKVWLEYDRYQDEQFVRLLAWVWVNCESGPKFEKADYMHKTKNESNPGLTDNPVGCRKGKLINEEMYKQGLVKLVKYSERGPTKYEARLKKLGL